MNLSTIIFEIVITVIASKSSREAPRGFSRHWRQEDSLNYHRELLIGITASVDLHSSASSFGILAFRTDISNAVASVLYDLQSRRVI